MNYRRLEQRLFNVSTSLYQGIGSALGRVYEHKGRIALALGVGSGAAVGFGVYDAVANPPAVVMAVKDAVKGSALQHWNNVSVRLRNLGAKTVHADPGYAPVDIAQVKEYLMLDGKLGRIWGYDRTNGFQLYDPKSPQLNDLARIHPASGYWVLMNEGVRSPVQLYKGWNLVAGSRLIDAMDFDRDGMSNGFEINVSKTDPYTYNGRYALVIDASETQSGDHVDNLKKVLVKGYGFKPENVIALRDNQASWGNFKSGMEEIAIKSTKDDLVYIFSSNHSGPINVVFLGQAERIPSIEIDKLMDRITARVLVHVHESSYSKTVSQQWREGPSPRIIYLDKFGTFLGIIYNNFKRDRYEPEYIMNDSNGDGHFSLVEMFGMPELDTHNMASSTYLGEFNPEFDIRGWFLIP